MRSEQETFEKLNEASTIQMDLSKQRAIWQNIQREIRGTTAIKQQKRRRLNWLATSGAGVAAVIIAVVVVMAISKQVPLHTTESHTSLGVVTKNTTTEVNINALRQTFGIEFQFAPSDAAKYPVSAQLAADAVKRMFGRAPNQATFGYVTNTNDGQSVVYLLPGKPVIHYPVWVLSTTGVKEQALGGLTTSGSASKNIKLGNAVSYAFVDATSGRVLVDVNSASELQHDPPQGQGGTPSSWVESISAGGSLSTFYILTNEHISAVGALLGRLSINDRKQPWITNSSAIQSVYVVPGVNPNKAVAVKKSDGNYVKAIVVGSKLP